MPLTLNVGLSKKRGQPHYSSVGAFCNLTVELDAALLARNPRRLRRHIRRAYAACARAVNEELDRQRPPSAAEHNGRPTAASGPGSKASGGNGEATGCAPPAAGGRGPASRDGGTAPDTCQCASERQISYAHRLARAIGALGSDGLARLSEELFGKGPAELSSGQASRLIDTLQDLKQGRLSLAAVRSGRAPT